MIFSGPARAWLAAQLATLSAKTPLAAAIRYALARIARLRPWLDHGVLEIDNNAAERAMRAIADRDAGAPFKSTALVGVGVKPG